MAEDGRGLQQAGSRDEARTELGDTDAPAEDQVSEAFDVIVSEGAQRLHRTWREVLSTGLAGGLEVATSSNLSKYSLTSNALRGGMNRGRNVLVNAV